MVNNMSVMAYPPPIRGVDYHLLPPTDPLVQKRVAIWASYPVAFCREAMNFFPHWYQEELITDKSLFIAACWSRQIGKSRAIAYKAVHTAFVTPNADVIIIAPARRQAHELYEKVKQAIKDSPLVMGSVVGRMTVEKVEFANGSRIINLPAGDEGVTLRGYSIVLLIVEEAAFIPNDVFVAVEQGLSSTGGAEIMISTPRGRHNEFFRAFFPEWGDQYDMEKQGQQTINEWSCYRYDYKVGFDVFKPDGNPQLSEVHVQRQKNKLPEWKFRAEYMAEFIEDIDSYWSTDIIEATFNKNFYRMEEPRKGANYFFGIDISRGGDYTALSIAERLDVNPDTGKRLVNPHVQIVNVKYWRIGSIEAQYPHIVAAVSFWKPTMIYFDETSMGIRPFEELKNTYKLPITAVTFTGPQKVKLYGTLTMLMSMPGEISGWEKRLQIYPEPEVKSQFSNMIYEIPEVKTKTGGKRQGSSYHIYAAKGHDDIPDSVALACKCVEPMAIDVEPRAVTKPTSKKKEFTRDERVQSSMVTSVKNRGKRYRGTKHPKVFW